MSPRGSRAWLLAAAGLIAIAPGGCRGLQNPLDPRGPQSEAISGLWWLMFSLGVAVFLVVMGLLGYALWRARRSGEEIRLDPRHGRNLVLWGGLAVPILILFVLLVASLGTDRRMLAFGGGEEDDLVIEITGRQFWWDVRYRADHPQLEFRTANEIHLPVGRPVTLHLRSADVIHSFWVPNLHGKMDLIPGRVNSIRVQADEPGVFRGQCAEFCGDAHAQMRMIVVAMAPGDFEAWRAGQLRGRERPEDSRLARGFDVFMGNGCAFCHAVRGTLAGGRVGPDLTHFGARRTIAAGTFPNTRGHLAGWITDPQSAKPGNYMPSIPIEGEDLQALLDYLQSLR